MSIDVKLKKLFGQTFSKTNFIYNLINKWLNALRICSMSGRLLVPGPNRVIAKNVKRCTYCCYVRCTILIVRVGEIPWPQTDAT